MFILLLVCCRDVPSGQPGSPPGDDRWWVATCGEVMPLRVGNDHSVTPPQLLERVEPLWPDDGISGIVIIETVVDANGRICDARVLRGLNQELDAIALAAVKQWRFRPALLDGVPRASVYAVSVAKKRGADL